jgi:Tol biopolymer transport system component
LGAQIADALAEAHAKGVTHRDLKPSNVMVTKKGVKLLDFGLAAVDGEALTKPGAVMGTPAYMAPEQFKGNDAGPQTDIYALGLLLHEMASGRRPAVQPGEPAVLARLPGPLQPIVGRCLAENPDTRWRGAGEIRALLEVSGESSTGVPPGPQTSTLAGSRRYGILAAAVAVATIAGVALLAAWLRPSPVPAEVVRFEVGSADGMTLTYGSTLDISPDGKWMVFPAIGDDGQNRYWVRSLDGLDQRPLPGTEIDTTNPSAGWSFDSRWVLFAQEDKLKKIDITGGQAQTIAEHFPGVLSGASWNANGIIIAGATVAGNPGNSPRATESPIFRVPAGGGALTALTTLVPGDRFHAFPQFLPDGTHFLYERVNVDAVKTGIYIGSLDTKPEQQSMERLLATDHQAYYSAESSDATTGHLISLQQTTLMAQPFDAGSRTLTGNPVAIAEGVGSYPARNYAVFSVSKTGTLSYHRNPGAQMVLTWFDSRGNPTGTLGNPGEYLHPAISPDGGRVAVAAGPPTNRDIWILDVLRGTSSRFSFTGEQSDYPVWSPDGKRIVFGSGRSHLDLYAKPTDGSGEERLRLSTGAGIRASQWSSDGRFLLFESVGAKTAEDLWVLPTSGANSAIPILQTEASERFPRLSPDGRWLAYVSYESGSAEVYVRPFHPEGSANTGVKWLVSNGLAVHPRWSPDGKRLYYMKQGGQLTVVDVDTRGEFQVVGTPRSQFTGLPPTLTTGWDLSPDGMRFLFITPPRASSVAPMTVVLNWAAGLHK